jgi:hypothetical protein
MGRAHSMHVKFLLVNFKGRDHLGDLDVDNGTE